MTVALIDLSPELSYTSVPRLSPHSFLQAKAKNTSHYAMLAGPSNIFLDNNFIAKVNVTYAGRVLIALPIQNPVHVTCIFIIQMKTCIRFVMCRLHLYLHVYACSLHVSCQGVARTEILVKQSVGENVRQCPHLEKPRLFSR